MIPLLLLAGLVLQEDARAPRLEPVRSATSVPGASLWLFAVPDGKRRLVASAENTRSLLVGMLDHRRRRPQVRWIEAAGSKDTGRDNIADHWHIFAHGHHWISFSIGRAGRAYLLKLDENLERKGLWVVADRVSLPWKGGRHAPRDREGRRQSVVGMPTNDHFLVAEADGVAVGFFYPAYGHRIYRLSLEGRLRETVDVGGGRFRHANGSSALPMKSGYLLLATETLNMVQQGGVSLLRTDADWKPTSIRRVIDEERKNVAMPSGVLLPNGYLIVVARVVSNAYPRGVMPPPPPKDRRGPAPDDGAIVRYVISPKGKVVSREVLQEEGGNRPHLSLLGDLLVTTWDGRGTRLRVDRVR